LAAAVTAPRRPFIVGDIPSESTAARSSPSSRTVPFETGQLDLPRISRGMPTSAASSVPMAPAGELEHRDPRCLPRAIRVEDRRSSSRNTRAAPEPHRPEQQIDGVHAPG